jgi:hypothetical protein
MMYLATIKFLTMIMYLDTVHFPGYDYVHDSNKVPNREDVPNSTSSQADLYTLDLLYIKRTQVRTFNV